LELTAALALFPAAAAALTLAATSATSAAFAAGRSAREAARRTDVTATASQAAFKSWASSLSRPRSSAAFTWRAAACRTASGISTSIRAAVRC